MKKYYQSWGRYPRAEQEVVRLWSRHDSFPLDRIDGMTALPRGNGRSYGDSCLNDGGMLIDVRGLDRFIDFDPESGILRCEGTFDRGDVVRICDEDGTEFARGLAAHDAEEIRAQTLRRVEVVHRDNLVIL